MSSSKPDRHEARDALQLARRYLRFGTRSSAELRAYFSSRGVAEAEGEAVLTECARLGWINDEACATLWATTLAERGFAWRAVRERLLAKGLDAELIARVIRPFATQATDEHRASVLVRDRLRGRRLADPRERSRVARLLTARGFDHELIERVLAASPDSPHE